MKTLLLFLLLVICPMVVQAQSDTCTDGQSLVIDTVNKRYKCITISGGSLGAGGNVNMTVANASSTGTTVNKLAKLTGAPSTAVIAATSDTENAVGIVTAGAGTTGSATIAIMGQASCVFDGATTAGNYFTISSTVAGDCHDGGSSFPTGGATYGRVLSTNGAGGTFTVELMTPDVAFQNAGNGKSKPGGNNLDLQWNNSGVFAGGTLKTNGTSQVYFPDSSWTFGWGTGGGAYVVSANANGVQVNTGADLTVVNSIRSGGLTPKIYISANVSSAGGLSLVGNNNLGWVSSSSDASGSQDIGLSREAAGKLEVNKGNPTSAGSSADLRDISVRSYFALDSRMYSSGTPSIAGNGTLNSNSKDSAGKITSTGTGASTVVLTFSAAFTNAPACIVTNETTSNLVRPISTTTTLTVNATVVTGDSISYICLGY